VVWGAIVLLTDCLRQPRRPSLKIVEVLLSGPKAAFQIELLPREVGIESCMKMSLWCTPKYFVLSAAQSHWGVEAGRGYISDIYGKITQCGQTTRPVVLFDPAIKRPFGIILYSY
jgi:hypothetical protein